MNLSKSGLAVLAACSITAALVACGSGGDDPLYSAQVRRTSFGIPHVVADNVKGVGYGIGYAFAQDNLCVLADMIVTVNGERSKYFGPDATYDLMGNGRQQANLSSDFYHKYLNDSAKVEASWIRQPQEIKELSKGYAAGFNRYLREVGAAGLPDACKSQPWVREITAHDLMRVQRRYAVTASGANFMDGLYGAVPPVPVPVAASKRSSTALASAAGYTRQPDSYWSRFRNDLGSNGVALGKESTDSGAGLLLANPHFPWTTAMRFYQMHLTIPGQLDVMGASLYGFPGVNIGFNRNVAWTHTFNTSAHFTLFYLQLDPTNPTKYIVDGVSKPMTSVEYSVEVKTGATTTDIVKRSYWFSEHGPLMTLPGALEWTAGAAYALADANAGNDRMFEQWWAMNKAGSMAEFKTAIETTIGTPWVQTIATDKPGNSYYGNISPVPNVSAAKEAACVPAPFASLKDSGIYVLAGNTAACAWDVVAGTPAPGIFPASSLPSLTRTDYVQNSNDSAWLTNRAAPMSGYPSIVSIDSTPQGARTRTGLTQIAARLAGTDGLPGNKFSMASLQSIAFSNRSWYASVLLADLKTACVGAGNVTLDDATAKNIAPGCAVINGWDGTANVTSIGWPLFHAWRTLMSASGNGFWTVPFSAADPVNTPRGLKVTDPAVLTLARKSLGQAMQTLEAGGIDYSLPWGQIQVAVRGSKRIPIPGGDVSDIYNGLGSRPTGTGQLDVFFGSSTVMTVSFDSDVPKAQGFLTYSQSTNPASPHYSDQTERFSTLNWITFPFTDAAITADPNYKTTSISE